MRKGENKADQKAALKAMFSQPPKTKREMEIEKEKELGDQETAQTGGPVDGGISGVPGVGGLLGVRTKRPTDIRKGVGKINTTEVYGNGYEGKDDSSTGGG